MMCIGKANSNGYACLYNENKMYVVEYGICGRIDKRYFKYIREAKKWLDELLKPHGRKQ